VQPRRTPDETKHCHFSDSVMLTNKKILLVGPFDFETKLHGIPANQIIPLLQWELLAVAFHEECIIPLKKTTDPVLATHTILIATSTSSVAWYHFSSQYTSVVLATVDK